MLGTFQLGLDLLGTDDQSSPSLDQSVSNTLNLTQSGSVNKSIGVSANNSLSLTQQVIPVKDGIASNTLTITQDTLADKSKFRRIFDNLFLTQSATVTRVANVNASNTLALTQSTKRVIFVTASNNLALTQDDAFVKSKYIAQTLTITHSVTLQKIYNRSVIQSIGINHTYTVNKSIQVGGSSILSFGQTSQRQNVKTATASNTLVFTEEAVRTKIIAASSNLIGLSHSVSLVRVLNRSAASTLALIQNMQRNVNYGRSVANTLQFFNSRTKTIRIGTLTEVLIPNAALSIVRGFSTVCGEKENSWMTFQAVGKIITMPRPLLGDKEAGTGAFNLSYSMTGIPYTTVKRSLTETLNWEFDIRYDKFRELSDFIFEANAQAFLINDFKGRQWVGKLMSNPVTFTDHLEPQNCDSKITVSLDFEALRLH